MNIYRDVIFSVKFDSELRIVGSLDHSSLRPSGCLTIRNLFVVMKRFLVVKHYKCHYKILSSGRYFTGNDFEELSILNFHS